jgi:hypothetical protein
VLATSFRIRLPFISFQIPKHFPVALNTPSTQ